MRQCRTPLGGRNGPGDEKTHPSIQGLSRSWEWLKFLCTFHDCRMAEASRPDEIGIRLQVRHGARAKLEARSLDCFRNCHKTTSKNRAFVT